MVRVSADRVCSRLRDRVVVLDARSGDTDRTDDRVAVLDRDPSGKRDQSSVGVLDVVQGPAGLRQATDVAGVHIEVSGGTRLPLGDVDASEPRAVLAAERL